MDGGLRLGSLCSGYGGLDVAAELALGPLHHTWHADNDPDAARVLDRHWPGTPNLGDLTTTDWAAVLDRYGPVDVLTAGYPCQPYSNAGQRKGAADDRAIWPHIAAAIGLLRPRHALFENVPGHLGRGLDRVLWDLAHLGYVGSWMCVRASDLGAPHRRERVFIAAHPATDPGGEPLWPQPVPVGARHSPAEFGNHRQIPDLTPLLPTPAARDWKGRGYTDQEGRPLSETVMRLLPSPTAADAMGGPGHTGRDGSPNLRTEVTLLPTPRASEGTNGGPNQRGSHGDLTLSSVTPTLFTGDGPTRWGAYQTAITRWEHICGRTAPDPTTPGPRGGRRLSAMFVEWLMGLPQGWVTAVPNLTRNAQLRLLGNGVVPTQGAQACRALTTRQSP